MLKNKNTNTIAASQDHRLNARDLVVFSEMEFKQITGEWNMFKC